METTLVDSESDIIHCFICKEIYQTPKYLPCFHTFCETCLNKYITSLFNASSFNTDVNKPKSFPCPICRFDVPVSHPCLTAEDIISKIPANPLIITLIAQQILNSKDKFCNPCLLLDTNNTAVSWCTVCNEALCLSCDRIHKVMKVSKSHKICLIENIPSVNKIITTLEFCTQHKEEKMELYCMDHKQSCCAKCLTLHHRKCEDIKTLDEAANGINKSLEIKELTNSVDTMINKLSTVLESKRLNKEQLQESKTRYQENITRMRQDIIKHLSLLEEKVNSQLEERHKETSILIANEIAEIETNLKIFINYKKLLDTGLKNVSDIHKFLETDKIKQQHERRSEVLMKRFGEMRNHIIKCRFEDNWENLISNLKKIGTVTSNLKNCTAREISNFSTGNWIVDGIFLPNDQILLVDYDGLKIIFCTSDGRMLKEKLLSMPPWDIVQINDREAAVVLPGTQNIQCIDIENGELGNLITVNKTLTQGIGYTGTNLIVGGKDGNIYMIDRTGNIIKTLVSGSNTEYISCTSTKTYLASDKLICIDMNGSQIFSYTNSNFRAGQGISFDREGNIYCCDYWSNNIHQLTPDGQFIKHIVTDIAHPRGIAFDKSGERFLVTYDNNSVSVYELQQ